MGVDLDLGMDLDMRMDLGMDLNLDMDSDSDLDLDMGMNLDMDLDLDMGMDLDMDLAMRMDLDMDLGMDLDMDLDADMTRTIKVCDICQSEITNKEQTVMNENEEVIGIELMTAIGSKRMDLCYKCSTKLIHYICHMSVGNSQETHSLQ